jgi:hypothetical protein
VRLVQVLAVYTSNDGSKDELGTAKNETDESTESHGYSEILLPFIGCKVDELACIWKVVVV